MGWGGCGGTCRSAPRPRASQRTLSSQTLSAPAPSRGDRPDREEPGDPTGLRPRAASLNRNGPLAHYLAFAFHHFPPNYPHPDPARSAAQQSLRAEALPRALFSGEPRRTPLLTSCVTLCDLSALQFSHPKNGALITRLTAHSELITQKAPRAVGTSSRSQCSLFLLPWVPRKLQIGQGQVLLEGVGGCAACGSGPRRSPRQLPLELGQGWGWGGSPR